MILALLAAERWRQKMKIQIPKGKVSFFAKKIIIFEISEFFLKDPLTSTLLKIFLFFIFQKFQKKRIPQMTFMGPFKDKKERSQEFWVA